MGYCSTRLTSCSSGSSRDFKIQKCFWVGSFSYPLAPGRGHSIRRFDLHINWTRSITHLLKLICFTAVSHYLSHILQQAFNLIFHIVLCFIMSQALFIKIHLANNAHACGPFVLHRTYSDAFGVWVSRGKMGNVENSLEYEKQSHFLYQ